MNSDTGFDLQFSKTSGLYGTGIYFALNASYSHKGYAYSLGDGRYQMFLADVFIGKPFKSDPNNGLVKAPNGYDSVSGQNGIHVVYNNFHSYPLYLIEYTTSNQTQQHVTPSISSYISYVNQLNSQVSNTASPQNYLTFYGNNNLQNTNVVGVNRPF